MDQTIATEDNLVIPSYFLFSSSFFPYFFPTFAFISNFYYYFLNFS